MCHKIITFLPVPGKCEDFREELNKKIRNLAASTITWNKKFCDENMTSCISGLIVTHFWSYRHAFLVLSSRISGLIVTVTHSQAGLGPGSASGNI